VKEEKASWALRGENSVGTGIRKKCIGDEKRRPEDLRGEVDDTISKEGGVLARR